VALETLCEILQSFIVELGRSSRAHAEVASRTEPLSADVIMGLTSLGFPETYDLVGRMRDYAMRPNRAAVDDPVVRFFLLFDIKALRWLQIYYRNKMIMHLTGCTSI